MINSSQPKTILEVLRIPESPEWQITKIDEIVRENPGTLEEKDIHGYTPILVAAISGNIAVIKYLASKKADVQATNNDGFGMAYLLAYSAHKPTSEEGHNPDTIAPDIIKTLSECGVEDFSQLSHGFVHGAFYYRYGNPYSDPDILTTISQRVNTILPAILEATGTDLTTKVGDQNLLHKLVSLGDFTALSDFKSRPEFMEAVKAQDEMGNNVLHLLAKKVTCLDELESIFYVGGLNNSHPHLVKELLSQRNHDGLLPVEVAHNTGKAGTALGEFARQTPEYELDNGAASDSDDDGDIPVIGA